MKILLDSSRGAGHRLVPGALLIDHDLGEQDEDDEDDEDETRIKKRTMVLLSTAALIIMVQFGSRIMTMDYIRVMNDRAAIG